MEHQERAIYYARRIARMIQVDTVRRPGTDKDNFDCLHMVMAELFPRVFANCRKWEFESSLLFCWPGKTRKSLVLMSHQDVVEAPGVWRYPPFSGTIAEGKLWGRGSLDIKGNLHDIFQAVEELMEQGYTPGWDIYIAASHEEEIGGNDLIADFLRKQNIVPDMLVDEGSAIQPCPVPGFEGHTAMVSVAEKGYIDVKCVARGPGGHAGSPGKGTPLVRLGAFMCEVENSDLFPLHLSSASTEMYHRMAAMAKDEKTRDYLSGIAEQRPGWKESMGAQQKAMLGTTIAFTMASGSQSPNVIPQEAYVICNIRVAPGESVDAVVSALKTVADQYQVELEILRENEPSPVTDPKGEAFARVEQAIRASWPGIEVLPFLLSGGTDTKHFVGLCPNCLRFTAYKISADQQRRCHAIDENIDLDTIPNGVDFFKNLIQLL